MARPTKYLPEFDEMLIDHMAEGMSFESFAGKMSLSKQTLYSWAENYSTFMDAKKEGLEKCRYFWEKIGVAATLGKVENFNATCWIFNMKNRFHWSDRAELSIIDVKPTMIKRISGEVIELGVKQVAVNDED